MPVFNASVSKTGQIYWLGATVGDAALNTDLNGVASAEECYEVCYIVNDGPCWLFRYPLHFVKTRYFISVSYPYFYGAPVAGG